MVNRTCLLSLVVIVGAAGPATFAGGLGGEWVVVGNGQWSGEYEFRPVIRQTVEGASGRAVATGVKGQHGAWRCSVEPAPGTPAAGMIALADEKGEGGISCVLGGTGEMRGFALQSADGKTLWADEGAPWMSYEPCVIETVVESGRVRVQMFAWDGKTLVSQSPWVDAAKEVTDRLGCFGLIVEGGIARFWNWEIVSAPLSPITPDAPNKLRLAQGGDSPWILTGPHTWKWTDSSRQRIRQSANVERAWAFNRQLHGAHRRWTCRVKVSPGAGGAGMAFQSNGTKEQGLLCWLGGEWGKGCLMLYELPGRTVWCGENNKWFYDKEYVLAGETRRGEVRVQMFDADGKTVISESPWLKLPESITGREGMVGFHTWMGVVEFWGFDEATQTAAQGTEAKAIPAPGGPTGPWQADGTWVLKGDFQKILTHVGETASEAMNPAIRGGKGSWRCVVTPSDAASAALLFQVSDDRKMGFASAITLSEGSVTLELLDVAGKTLRSSRPTEHKPGTSYLLEGIVMTDRVRSRLLAADGKTVLADTGDSYVSDTNNTRVGHLGLRAAGTAEFTAWSYEPEK